MNVAIVTWFACRNKSGRDRFARHNAAQRVAVHPNTSSKNLPGKFTTMTNFRFVLLATTALTAMQFASSASHAQSAPLVVAQAQPETGPDGKPKQPPKEAPKAPPPAARPA